MTDKTVTQDVTVTHADFEAYRALMGDEQYDDEKAGAWHFARHRLASQNDAQMAAPDRLKNRMQSIADVLHCIADTVEDEGDRVYFSSTNDPHTIRRQAKAIETILAKLPASNAMRDALTVARNRLQSLAVRAPFNSSEGYDAAKWADEATAALAGQGTTLDRQTVEACKRAVRDRMVEQEWPPTDGDRQIDEVLEALDDLIEARASMDPNHVR